MKMQIPEYGALVTIGRGLGNPAQGHCPGPLWVYPSGSLPSISDRLFQLLPGDHGDLFSTRTKIQPPIQLILSGTDRETDTHVCKHEYT